VEAARIPWRPLGRILVEQGLLTSEELETALEQQERTGKRLGEAIVECGFVSGPELSNALATQYGIELTTETGFGTGLRGQIQRRHENERRSVRPELVRPALVDASANEDDTQPEEGPEPLELEPPPTAEASMLAQLEEQWAKLAAAEAQLAERGLEFDSLVRERDRRRDQAARLARRARGRSAEPKTTTHELQHLHDLAEQLRDQVNRLTDDVRGRDEEIGRLTHEGAQGHAQLAVAEVSLRERDHQIGELRNQVEHLTGDLTSREQELAGLRELGAAEARGREEELERLCRELEQAHHALAAAETAIARQNRRVEDLEADFERLVHSRTEVESAAQASLDERDRNLDALHQEVRRRRAQAGRFLERLRRQQQQQQQQRSAAEGHQIGELRNQVEHLTGDLDRLRAELEHGTAEAQGREEELERLRRELEQAHAPLAAAEAAIAGQNRRVEDLEADFERLVHSHAEVVNELRHQVEHLTGDLDRLHAELEHGTAEAQGREEELERLRRELEQAHDALASAAQMGSDTAADREALPAAEASIAERDHQLAELRAASEVLAADLRDRSEELERLAHERAASQEALAAAGAALTERDGELANLRSELEQLAADMQSRDGETERLARESAERERERDRRRAQAVRFARRLQEVREIEETHHALIAQLAADVRGCDEEIARNRRELAEHALELVALRAKHQHARGQAQRFVERLRRREHEAAALTSREQPALAPQIASHLVFVQLSDRYELVERAGPPPPRNASLELPELSEAALVVEGLGRSPLPGDTRPCVFVQAAVPELIRSS
jgi:chromosome segregation ATPase